MVYSKGNNFVVASNTLFADSSADRKSSQMYMMKLFGGLIGWQANKQNMVTTLTMEAKLLALSQAAKEGLYIGRLLKELTVKLDNHWIQMHCNNSQTIPLVTEEIAHLETKLQHVDIHNHWLRQEVSWGQVIIKYMPTKEIIMNGLTKVLP